MKQNVRINQAEDKIEVHELDWEHPKILVGEDEQEFSPEILFVADCVYDPELINALVEVLVHFLEKSVDTQNTNNEAAPHGHFPCAYVASTLRNPKTFQYFLDTLDSSGISHIDVTPDEPFGEKSPMPWKYDTCGKIMLTYLYIQK